MHTDLFWNITLRRLYSPPSFVRTGSGMASGPLPIAVLAATEQL